MEKIYQLYLPIEWNSIKLGFPAHGIVTKTVHKTLPVGPAVKGIQKVG